MQMGNLGVIIDGFAGAQSPSSHLSLQAYSFEADAAGCSA